MNKKQLMKMLDEMVESSVHVAESHATNGRPDAARYWTGRADAYRLVISSIEANDERKPEPTGTKKLSSDWGAEDYRNPADNCSRCGHRDQIHHTDSNRPGYSECSAMGCNCDCLTLSPVN